MTYIGHAVTVSYIATYPAVRTLSVPAGTQPGDMLFVGYQNMHGGFNNEALFTPTLSGTGWQTQTEYYIPFGSYLIGSLEVPDSVPATVSVTLTRPTGSSGAGPALGAFWLMSFRNVKALRYASTPGDYDYNSPFDKEYSTVVSTLSPYFPPPPPMTFPTFSIIWTSATTTGLSFTPSSWSGFNTRGSSSGSVALPGTGTYKYWYFIGDETVKSVPEPTLYRTVTWTSALVPKDRVWTVAHLVQPSGPDYVAGNDSHWGVRL